MVRTPSHKLVFVEDSHEPVQLFDLDEDPHEDDNLLLTGRADRLRNGLMADVVEPFLAHGPVRPEPAISTQRWRT
jgi:hypothetical protein